MSNHDEHQLDALQYAMAARNRAMEQAGYDQLANSNLQGLVNSNLQGLGNMSATAMQHQSLLNQMAVQQYQQAQNQTMLNALNQAAASAGLVKFEVDGAPVIDDLDF